MSVAQGSSLDEAFALAKLGDARAQYALSSELHELKRLDESLQWLRAAAAQQLAPAQITLATMLIDGRVCARDLQQANALLLPLAAAHAQANLLLAELHGFAALLGGNRETGLMFLLAAARLGDPGALRQLAMLCVCHQRSELVRPLLDNSARRGDGAAAYALANCYLEGIGGPADPAIALGVAGNTAARSQYLKAQLDVNLRTLNPHCAAALPPVLHIDWPELERALPQLATGMRIPIAEIVHDEPLIRKLPGVLHPLILDSLINLAQPLVHRSHIVDAHTGEARIDPMRNSSHVTLGPRQHDHVIEAIEECLSTISGSSSSNGEFLQILRYRPGEEFKPHVDYFNESGAGVHESLANGGQRSQTVLGYLNEGYNGGETTFPRLHLRIQGRRGDMLHFHNVGEDGRGFRDSLHAGAPVRTREKWLLSQWIRVDRYIPRRDW